MVQGKTEGVGCLAEVWGLGAPTPAEQAPPGPAGGYFHPPREFFKPAHEGTKHAALLEHLGGIVQR